jgi:hypothetical protein
MSTTEKLNLYRFEYLVDSSRRVDWVWLQAGEVQAFLDDLEGASIIYRQASSEEEELYDEAYNDGYGVAMAEESINNSNGIVFRVDGIQSLDPSLITTVKMFKCARCENYKDFETEVATTNGLYLSESKEDILWHICYDCVMLQSEIESIEFEPTDDER